MFQFKNFLRAKQRIGGGAQNSLTFTATNHMANITLKNWPLTTSFNLSLNIYTYVHITHTQRRKFATQVNFYVSKFMNR